MIYKQSFYKDALCDTPLFEVKYVKCSKETIDKLSYKIAKRTNTYRGSWIVAEGSNGKHNN